MQEITVHSFLETDAYLYISVHTWNMSTSMHESKLYAFNLRAIYIHAFNHSRYMHSNAQSTGFIKCSQLSRRMYMHPNVQGTCVQTLKVHAFKPSKYYAFNRSMYMHSNVQGTCSVQCSHFIVDICTCTHTFLWFQYKPIMCLHTSVQ